MLNYKKETGLTYNNKVIRDSFAIFNLKTELEVSFVGILTLLNGLQYSFPFEFDGNAYNGKLIITKEMLPHLKENKFEVVVFDSSFRETSNAVNLVFDVKAIEKKIVSLQNDQLKELTLKVQALESKLKEFTTKGVISNPLSIDMEKAKPGMIPVVLEGGHIGLAHPFEDVIKEINGVQASHKSLELLLENIPFEKNGLNTKEILETTIELIKKQSLVIKSVIETQKELIKELEKIKLEFAEHMNTAFL